MGWNDQLMKEGRKLEYPEKTPDGKLQKMPHTKARKIVSNTYAQVARAQSSRVQIMWNTLGANHVQHVVCHVVRRDSSGIQFDRVKIAFILALFYWLKWSTDEGGKEAGVSGENARWQASENAILKPRKSSHSWDSNLRSSTGGRLGKQTC